MADAGASPRRKPKDRTVAEIEKLARQRESRRKSAEAFKRKREHEIKVNEKKGMPGDVDFQRMIKRFRKYEMTPPCEHKDTGPLKINVVVRKRPVSESEIRRKDFDSVSCSNPRVFVHHCKLKVDGISKFLNNLSFELDHAFHESATNEEVYKHTAKYLVEFAAGGGRATCFAYGQTGSGKTYTMGGVQALAARDVFELIRSEEHRDKQLDVCCAFFELYSGRCMDLLHDRRECSIREDGKGRVHVEGLQEIVVEDFEELLGLIERGNGVRTTHATEMNNDSSRSHAICQIALRRRSARPGSEPYGKLSLIDLAGSERGQDTKHHNRQRRQESAEINKSLLALKECVRALDSGSSHVPYRASKLTMVLKDSFSNDARTVMISCISPVASSADHTVNTLRYADRVKEKAVRTSSDAAGPNVRRIADYSANAAGSPDGQEFDSSDSDEGDMSLEDKFDEAEEDSGLSLPPPPADPPARRATPAKRAVQVPRATPVKAPVPVSSPARSAQRSRAPATKAPSGGTPKAAQRSKIQAPSSAARAVRKQWDDPAADPVRVGARADREPLQANNAVNGESQQNRSRAAGKQSAPSQRQGSNNREEEDLGLDQQEDEVVPRGHQHRSKPSEGRSERKASFGRGSRSREPQNADMESDGTDHASNEDDKGDGGEALNFQDVVRQLVDMEEELLSAHMKAIQKNADLLTEEGVLLSKVQGSDVVDYDIDEYASRLDKIIDSKVRMFTDLQGVLRRFRKHLALDHVASNVIEGGP